MMGAATDRQAAINAAADCISGADIFGADNLKVAEVRSAARLDTVLPRAYVVGRDGACSYPGIVVALFSVPEMLPSSVLRPQPVSLVGGRRQTQPAHRRLHL